MQRQLQQIGNGIISVKEAFVPVSIDEAVERAEIGLGRALEFLRSEGIQLNKRPTIVYIGDQLGKVSQTVKGHALATANIIPSIDSEALTGIILEYQRKMLLRGYGIIVSDAAIMSLSNHDLSQRQEQENANLPCGDIYLYGAARRGVVDLAPAMVHETWHIADAMHGFYDLFTNEGIATYAANRFLGRQSPWIQLQPWFDPRVILRYMRYGGYSTIMVYNNAAHFVEEALRDEPQPLTALLKPDTRAAVRDAVERNVFPHIYRPAHQDFPIPPDWPLDALLVNTTDAFAPFRKERSPNALVKSFKDYGLTQFADEIAHQDLTVITRYFACFLT